MSTDADNLVLQHLRAIRADITDIREGQREILARVSNLEATVAGMRRDLANSYADIVTMNARLDRLSDRIGRIERRLQLSDEVPT